MEIDKADSHIFTATTTTTRMNNPLKQARYGIRILRARSVLSPLSGAGDHEEGLIPQARAWGYRISPPKWAWAVDLNCAPRLGLGAIVICPLERAGDVRLPPCGPGAVRAFPSQHLQHDLPGQVRCARKHVLR